MDEEVLYAYLAKLTVALVILFATKLLFQKDDALPIESKRSKQNMNKSNKVKEKKLNVPVKVENENYTRVCPVAEPKVFK